MYNKKKHVLIKMSGCTIGENPKPVVHENSENLEMVVLTSLPRPLPHSPKRRRRTTAKQNKTKNARHATKTQTSGRFPVVFQVIHISSGYLKRHKSKIILKQLICFRFLTQVLENIFHEKSFQILYQIFGLL